MSSIPDSLLSEYRARVDSDAAGTLHPFKADDHYEALWRSSAMERTPYTEDFPEPLLVIPELYDGSLGQGRASNIKTTVVVYDDGVGVLSVTDNGRGLSNLPRFLQWAASKSESNYHRNGHGAKKCLTKWAPNFQKAVWAVEYRVKGRDPIVVKYPYNGIKTYNVGIEDDDESLTPSGTAFHVVFDIKVLGAFNTAEKLAAGIQEIIETRYHEPVFGRVEFELDIEWPNSHVVKRSKDPENLWHSFRFFVDQEVAAGNAVKEMREEKTSHGCPWTLDRYKISIDGKKTYALKTRFPHYGQKNGSAQRILVSLNERMIEAIHYHKLAGKPAVHNVDNGTIVFVTFVGDFSVVPEPSTTKVSMYEHDPIFTQFKEDIRRVLNPAATEVVPAPVHAPRGVLGQVADALAAVMAPAAVQTPAVLSPKRNVTKDVLCRAFDVEASITGESLIIVYNGERYDMSSFKISAITFERR